MDSGLGISLMFIIFLVALIQVLILKSCVHIITVLASPSSTGSGNWSHSWYTRPGTILVGRYFPSSLGMCPGSCSCPYFQSLLLVLLLTLLLLIAHFIFLHCPSRPFSKCLLLLLSVISHPSPSLHLFLFLLLLLSTPFSVSSFYILLTQYLLNPFIVPSNSFFIPSFCSPFTFVPLSLSRLTPFAVPNLALVSVAPQTPSPSPSPSLFSNLVLPLPRLCTQHTG